MRHPPKLLFCAFLFIANFVYAFDLSPKTKDEKDLAKHWIRSKVVKSQTRIRGEAQVFLRYARIRGKILPVARMTVIEVDRKELKSMDPDTANFGLGFLLGFKAWSKTKIAEGTYRYLGYDRSGGRLMQVLWKEDKDKFLYSSAFIESEMQTPVAYEVELLQRRLLKSSKKFSFNEFLGPFFNVFEIPKAHAADPPYKKSGYLGSPEEQKALFNVVNMPEENFNQLYRNMKDGTNSLFQIQSYAQRQGLMNPSESSLNRAISGMFNGVTPKQIVDRGTFVSMMTGAAALGGPMGLGGAEVAGIAYSLLDKLYDAIYELCTKDKEYAQLIEDSNAAFAKYVSAEQVVDEATTFRDGLAKLKNSLNELGFTDANISSGRGVNERLKTYKNFLEKVDDHWEKTGEQICNPGRIQELMEDLKPVVDVEGKLLSRLKICKTIDNIGNIISNSLSVKTEARISYLKSVMAIVNKIEKDKKLRNKAGDKITNDFPMASQIAIENLRKTVKEREQEYSDRKGVRMEQCRVRHWGQHSPAQITSLCNTYDESVDPVGRKEQIELAEVKAKASAAIEVWNENTRLATEASPFKNSTVEIIKYDTLGRLTNEMLKGHCLEPGNKCSDVRTPEQVEKVEELLKQRAVSKAEIDKACPPDSNKK